MRIFLATLSLILLLLFACSPVTTNSPTTAHTTKGNPPTAEANYQEYCAGCHGAELEAFVDRQWAHGSSEEALFQGIKLGYDEEGMPGFDTTFTDKEIHDLITYMQVGIKKVDQYKFEQEEAIGEVYESEEQSFRLETITEGVKIPWGMAFLPNGDLLITDKGGELYRWTKGQLQKITGVPEVLAKGQGGLMDVEVHPQFQKNKWVYLSYSVFKNENGQRLSSTAISKAKLVGNELIAIDQIFEALPYSRRRHHYGCRLEFSSDGFLFFSVGDRGNRDENPQSLDNHCGKIHRIHQDGRIPLNNPFVNTEGAMPSIYSYGHRNPQGVILNPTTKQIWTHEHGPRGGDEVNIIHEGKNYGWPIISYGINYNGTTFTNKTEQDGMMQPLHYWVPSIAPCGMDFIRGDKYPAWKGDLLVGSLRFEYLNRCKVVNDKIVHEESLLKNIGRVRNVKVSPEGYIYVATEKPGRVYKILPLK